MTAAVAVAKHGACRDCTTDRVQVWHDGLCPFPKSSTLRDANAARRGAERGARSSTVAASRSSRQAGDGGRPSRSVHRPEPTGTAGVGEADSPSA